MPTKIHPKIDRPFLGNTRLNDSEQQEVIDQLKNSPSPFDVFEGEDINHCTAALPIALKYIVRSDARSIRIEKNRIRLCCPSHDLRHPFYFGNASYVKKVLLQYIKGGDHFLQSTFVPIKNKRNLCVIEIRYPRTEPAEP